MSLVNGPARPVELGELTEIPYCMPSPFYVGSRCFVSAGVLQELARMFLRGRGILRDDDESLVYAWVMTEEGPALTVVKHEVAA